MKHCDQTTKRKDTTAKPESARADFETLCSLCIKINCLLKPTNYRQPYVFYLCWVKWF